MNYTVSMLPASPAAQTRTGATGVYADPPGFFAAWRIGAGIGACCVGLFLLDILAVPELQVFAANAAIAGAVVGTWGFAATFISPKARAGQVYGAVAAELFLIVVLLRYLYTSFPDNGHFVGKLEVIAVVGPLLVASGIAVWRGYVLAKRKVPMSGVRKRALGTFGILLAIMWAIVRGPAYALYLSGFYAGETLHYDPFKFGSYQFGGSSAGARTDALRTMVPNFLIQWAFREGLGSSDGSRRRAVAVMAGELSLLNSTPHVDQRTLVTLIEYDDNPHVRHLAFHMLHQRQPMTAQKMLKGLISDAKEDGEAWIDSAAGQYLVANCTRDEFMGFLRRSARAETIQAAFEYQRGEMMLCALKYFPRESTHPLSKLRYGERLGKGVPGLVSYDALAEICLTDTNPQVRAELFDVWSPDRAIGTTKRVFWRALRDEDVKVQRAALRHYGPDGATAAVEMPDDKLKKHCLDISRKIERELFAPKR